MHGSIPNFQMLRFSYAKGNESKYLDRMACLRFTFKKTDAIFLLFRINKPR